MRSNGSPIAWRKYECAALTFVSAVMFAVYATGAAAGAGVEKSIPNPAAIAPVPAIQRQGDTLVVGSEQDFPPFATGMTDATAGGFTVDLWRAVAAEAGLKYTIRVQPFHQLIREFKEGKIDVLINLAQSDERRQFADFTVPHVIVHGAIFVRKDETRIRSESDLVDKSIIVLNTDLAHQYAESKGWAKQLKLVDTAASGLRALSSGQNDAMLLSKLTGLQTMRANGLTNIEPLKVKAGFSQRFAFAVRKGDSELLGKLNEGLAVTKSNGIYNSLYETWLGVYEIKEIGPRELLQYIAPLLLLFLAAGGFFFYKRQVERGRAEAALRDSEYRWKFAVEGAGDGLWDWNVPTGKVLYSKRWKEMLGFAEEEIGDGLVEWEQRVHPDDHAHVMPKVDAHLKGETPLYVSEHRVRCKDGSWKWILDRGLVVSRNSDGMPLRMIGTHSDITARKQAGAEKRLSAVIAASHDAMITVDESERIVFFSAAAEKLFQFPAVDAIGQPMERFIPERYREGHHAHIRQFAASGGTSREMGKLRRVSALRTDGTEFPVEASISSIESGGRHLLTVTLRDISERERSQADLARISELLRRTGELAKVGGWELDLASMTLFWSVETCRIHEIDPPIAPSIDDAINFYAPEARPAIAAAVKAGIETGTPWDLELPLITATGRRIWVRAQGAPLNEGDKPVKLVGAFQDITDRKRAEVVLRKSEEQLRLVLRGGDLGLWDVNLVAGALAVNERWLSMIGLDPLGPMPTMDEWRSLIHPDDLPKVDGAFSDIALNQSVHEFEAEIRARHVDGGLVWILKKGAVVDRAADGKPLRVAGTHMNITARKQAEAMRESLQAQLRESQKMQAIGTLAGGIAHDFNNIIATILGNADLARRDLDNNPSALESLDEIRKAGGRARDLVQQILSFSRRQPTERRPIALRPMVEESSRLLRTSLPPRLTLQIYCEADVPNVLADPTQIEQVVINLATNAMQAMRSGPGRIDIRLDTVMLDAAFAEAHPALRALHAAHPGRTVRLAVIDNGPGMDTATLERIFEPFFTTKPVDEGTGLGLSVVHGIVQAHEGAITVDSQPGKGATFTVYLPAAQVTTVAAATEPDSEVMAVVADTNSGQHILYLDDDESLVFLVTRLLQRRGYRVSGFIDQREALAAIRANPPTFDLVVTDYNMPGMSGLDVAREIRTIRADLPVAVASGFIDEALHAQAGGAGVRELIFKASAVEDLCETFARLAKSVGKTAASS